MVFFLFVFFKSSAVRPVRITNFVGYYIVQEITAINGTIVINVCPDKNILTLLGITITPF